MPITTDPAITRLISRINDAKDLDFSQYRVSTLTRRVDSRLRKNKVNSYQEYMDVLESDPGEYEKLVNAITINVTEFFRNPESFAALDRVVMPGVIRSKFGRQRMAIRVWSCGCSSGDEPYSIAIQFQEHLGPAAEDYVLNIVGSDINDDALSEAKNMIYGKERLKGVSKPVLDKYFEKTADGKFRLQNQIGKHVWLTHHDIVKDPPFRHCDIVLCRNLLIYFKKELQERVLLKFHEALNPGGFLILGMAESLVGAAADSFEPVDARLRIYQKPEN